MGLSKNSKARAGRGAEATVVRKGKEKRAIVQGATLREQAVGDRSRVRYDRAIIAFCEYSRAHTNINFGIAVTVILSLMLAVEIRRYLVPSEVIHLDILMEHYFELAFSEDPIGDGGGEFFCSSHDVGPSRCVRLFRGHPTR